MEKKEEACGLTGGDGEGELNGAAPLKDPGMLTGAELWSWLPPVDTTRGHACPEEAPPTGGHARDLHMEASSMKPEPYVKFTQNLLFSRQLELHRKVLGLD